MKILITGGAGFIGTKICNKLKDKFEIIVLDNFSHQIHGDEQPKLIEGVDYVNGDVTNSSDWEKVMLKNPDYIIHLAAETGTGQSMDEIIRYVNTNVMGTSVMLEFLNKNKNNVKKIILSSTRAVYGDLENNSDTLVVDPKSVYAVTKLAQENLLKTSSKVPYTILRYQNVFGDGQSLKNPYTGIISIFSNIFLENKPITIFDNGLPTRDFIYVEDVVDVTIKCLDNDLTNHKTYDIGTGVETKILDVTIKLKELFNSTSEILITDYHRDGDIMFAKGDITKIKNDLGWEPRFTVEDGLKFFYNWFKEEKNL
jgi:dTDP-L-rhamnose 4-epimerase